MPSTLSGRRALVTGASRGIGRAVAIQLAAHGADVVLTYRERADDAAAVVRQIRDLGRQAVAIRADVSRAADIAALVDEALADGTIDILINNAGLAKPVPLDALTEADWHEAISINLTSAFLVTQAVLPLMRARRWGRVVFLSSVAAQLGGVVGPHYAASKAGLHGMMHFYAAHLAKEGITANVVAPALIETEMVTSNPNAKPALIPVGRFGQPDEVADVVLMLAHNGYITGQTFNVNGGWYAS